jgi:integrase
VVRRKKYQRGHLYKTGKRRQVWRARWVEPVRSPDGTLGRILRNEVIAEVRIVPTRRQAQALLDERLRRINHGQHVPQAVETFGEFVRRHWVPTMLPTFRPSTAEIYKVNLNKHVVPHFGEVRLCDLSTADVQAFVIKKAEVGMSWNTVNHLRNLVSRILSTALEWKFVSSNAARGVRMPPKQLSRPRRIITVGQAQALLNELHEPARTMVLVCMLAGVRAGELFALRWRHVDFQRGVLRIRESVHKGHYGPPKTRNSVRDLPLANIVAAALFEHRQRMGLASTDELVFPSRAGTALARNNVLRRIIYPVCDRAKIPRVDWHSLRHLHATLLSEAGEPLKVAQAQLGHADLQTTLGVYTHVMPDSQRRAVERIESLVFPNFPKFVPEERCTRFSD